ncbi:alpha-L-fucosidase [Chitinophaga filiformis]|uniref:alpha-L-fucosidase n=1 Tax=Chitinophaga filiformis TaxID=104663 RepID=A0ABY4HWC5_CHIFI|nr:alpha-L-fucosidase [Chitinophaga filiformis]UPK68091.1 alpha-L-fucosidase [Chitinophaga filiformis]
MIRKICKVMMVVGFLAMNGYAQTSTPGPCGPVPSENQVRWQEMEYYAFIHLSTNTFTDQEWGYGEDDPKIFNPVNLDCRQWARVCKEAGMKGIILTAKHHSGFCLWPSKYTEYSVKNASWRGGKGDIVRDLANACKEYGLKLGIYLSPWDRNSAVYGTPEYITYFRNQLKELLTNYGDIFEIWFDGANGGSGYYGGARETRKIDRTTYYDWKNTYKLIRQLQPKIVIWNDGGDRGDLRWVGTEGGYVGETNWSLLNATGEVPYDMLHHGLENGDSWVPAEVNTSIRPGWFYHAYEDSRVKSLPDLLNTYYSSFGRNGTLLLNFPVDKRGLIHETDEKAVLELAKAVKEAFAVNLAEKKKVSASNVRGNVKTFGAGMAVDGNKNTYWATDDTITRASLTIDFGKPVTFNRFLAQEYIKLGQRVKAFKVEGLVGGNWKELANGTTIGYKRILLFPAVTATRLRFTITGAKACPLISNIGVYNAPPVLMAPEIIRDQSGTVYIRPADSASVIYYTLDGSVPAKGAKRYEGPVQTDGKVNVKAIAYDPMSKKSSAIATEKFDISRKSWKISGIDDDKVTRVIDGDPATAWYQAADKKLPADIDIDMGKTENVSGFRYLPGQGSTEGIITHYQFCVSEDNKEWKVVDEGEFSNIKNNPLWQIKEFIPVKARYIRLRALRNSHQNDAAGYAELDIITR